MMIITLYMKQTIHLTTVRHNHQKSKTKMINKIKFNWETYKKSKKQFIAISISKRKIWKNFGKDILKFHNCKQANHLVIWL